MFEDGKSGEGSKQNLFKGREQKRNFQTETHPSQCAPSFPRGLANKFQRVACAHASIIMFHSMVLDSLLEANSEEEAFVCFM